METQPELFDAAPFIDPTKIKRPRRSKPDDSKPRWRALALPKVGRPEMCAECVRECHYEGRTSAAFPARHERSFRGDITRLCGPHAEPIRIADNLAVRRKSA